MAIRRRIGNLADTLLQSHLQRRNLSHQSELVKQRQIELAQQRYEEQREKARLDREHGEYMANLGAALGDPTGKIASRVKMPHLVPSEQEILGMIGTDIQKANELKDIPSDLEALLANTARKEMALDPRNIERLQTTANAERSAIESGIKTTKRAEAVPGPIKANTGPGGAEQTTYMTPFDAAEQGPFPTERTAQQEGSRQSVIVRAQNDAYAERASMESWARLPAQLKLEQEKRIAELATIGDKVQAEEVAKKNAAVNGLLPTYQEYRKLAVKVANSWAGARGTSSANIVGASSKLPVLGEFLASGAEAAHGWFAGLIDTQTEKDIAELNRLTDTLAQGMANAVLGNKGQTTENDRRTAKNILASSFTDAKTLEDLLAITDRMFTKMPTVAGQILSQDPFATPAQILEAVKAAVEAERAGQAEQAPAAPAIPAGLDSILSRPGRR
jgi:hypothetical protein